MPIQQPTAALRRYVFQYLGSIFHVSHTTAGVILAVLPRKARPSSIVSKISPIPNKPITAIRKSNPLISGSRPKVNRSWPVTLSIPMAASANPKNIAASVLKAGSLLMPTKLQNVSNCTAKNSGGPNCSANFATSGARKVMMMTATSAPKNDELNAAVSACAACPFCAIGYPSNVVATDHGSPGMLNRIEVMAPPNSAPQ